MPYRYSISIHVGTEPKDKSVAREHTGSWTEQIWSANLVDVNGADMVKLLTARAAFLPAQCAITGVRIANFSIDVNKLVPKGTSLVKVNYPGNTEFSLDLPQACMRFSGQGDGTSNAVRYTARAFPSNGITNGEWNNNGFIRTRVNNFIKLIVQQSWKTVVRDLTQTPYRVLEITAGVAKVTPAPTLAVNDFVRLVRVKDTNGNPVSGVFLVSAVAGSNVTLADFPAVTVKTSGHLRKDLLSVVAYGSLAVDRVGAKKIGAPLEKFRGRQSKRAA